MLTLFQLNPETEGREPSGRDLRRDSQVNKDDKRHDCYKFMFQTMCSTLHRMLG